MTKENKKECCFISKKIEEKDMEIEELRHKLDLIYDRVGIFVSENAKDELYIDFVHDNIFGKNIVYHINKLKEEK